ncbi:hypothetical protein RB195_015485 [Necator americanus]|uniref:Uncharacterized protein n=2 Tax=Necator americanus TaxID=51031 RepID=A0ABR1E5A8_NECAM
MSVQAFLILTLLFCVHAARQTCSYSHPRGYSLRWLILGDNVIFRLNFTNFPPSSFTGVSFETENNGDSETIIVEVNQGGVDVFDVDQHHLGVPLRVRDTVTILRSNYSGQKLFVEFSRPIVSELTDLNNCLMWNFITTPLKNQNGTYNVTRKNYDRLKIMCNVTRNCDAWELLNEEFMRAAISNPRIMAILEQYRLRRSSFARHNLNQDFGGPLSSGQYRSKRQSSYVPTNNIYGYDYSSSSSSDSSAARLIVNPNYYFLNDDLTSGYAQNYVKAEQNYRQNPGSFFNTAPAAVPLNDPVTSNEQQNTINYQQIQQMYPSRSTSTQQYTNNIYGYAYADTPVRTGSQITRGPSVTNVNSYQVTPTASASRASAPYQSVADLKTTRLRDPSTSSSSGTGLTSASSNQAMFYPYRTSTQYVYGGNQAASSQVGTSQLAGGTLFRDANTDPCSLPDPYWCGDYVKIYLNSSTTLNGFTRQAACQALAQTLQDSYNGCCQTLRTVGCR